MDRQSLYRDAIEAVLARDLPDEGFSDAVDAQFRLMAGIPPDEADYRPD